jgi:hypothetical protein
VSPDGSGIDDHIAVVSELDAMTARARSAIERKDLAAYIDLFAPDLRYRRADGRVLDRDGLMRDVREEFRRIDRVRVSSVRESLDIAEGRAEEILEQTMIVGVTIFLVIHRTWSYNRRCRFAWKKLDGVWRIDEVEILGQTIGPGLFHLGFMPPSQ